MSMTVEQRRTQVFDRQEFPAGHARLVKASSRYDRRTRFWVVEILRSEHVGQELEDLLWKPVREWPVSDPDAKAKAQEAYASTFMTLRALSA